LLIQISLSILTLDIDIVEVFAHAFISPVI
jgi:hypothetical protein